ncbi:MAG TPA: REP-associated tyrosine transposase [Candidatus Tripitaka californicus]|uniref:REP-associated tyrosine transposase n=1 Tax=Candidatus Tripitaka californicus TaxID=3367616 RepID=UPI0040281620
MKRIQLPYNAYSYVTSVTRDRIPFFKDKENVSTLLNTFSFYRKRGDFKLFGYIVMPNHFHAILLPLRGTISDILRNIKAYSGNVIRSRLGIDSDVWQDSFYDHKILNKKELIGKLNYMHNNPLRGGLVQDLRCYPYSSYMNFYTEDKPLLEIDIPE